MASSQQNFISREEYKQKKALDEARKQGKLPAQKDDEGNDINPHMPQYITQAPWYLNQSQTSLKHQKFFKPQDKPDINCWYDRGAKGYQATKYREGACENCGAMTHKAKNCFERPRKYIAKEVPLDYAAKRDRWNGFDAEDYDEIIKEHELFEIERKKRLLSQPPKEDEFGLLIEQPPEVDVDDEYKKQDHEQINFETKVVDPRTKTTSKQLRIREDTVKYLYDLTSETEHFDPKSRSLRQNEDPDQPYRGLNTKGENYYKYTGDTPAMLLQERLAWEKIEKGEMFLNSTADPTLLEKTYHSQKDELDRTRRKMVEMYGGGEHLKKTEEIFELIQTQKDVLDNELEEAENELKARKLFVDTKKRTNQMKKSKYPEDIFINNHTSVWGSWYNDTLGWGYDCCFSNDKQSYCEGEHAKKLAVIREVKKQKEEKLKDFMDQSQAGAVLIKDSVKDNSVTVE